VGLKRIGLGSLSFSVENNSIFLYMTGIGVDAQNKYTAIVAKIDSEVNNVWCRRIDSPLNNVMSSTMVSSEENETFIYTLGYGRVSDSENRQETTIYKWDAHGRLVWHRKLETEQTNRQLSSSISTEENGIYIYTVGYEEDCENKRKCIVAKRDNQGNLIWMKKLNEESDGYFVHSSVNYEIDDTYIYIAGDENLNNGFIIKLNKDGDLIWKKRLYTQGYNYFNSMSIDREEAGDCIIVAGRRCSSTNNTYAGLITKWDIDGNLICEKTLDIANSSVFFVSSLISKEDDVCYTYTTGFENDKLSDKLTALLAKWNTHGELIWEKRLEKKNNQLTSDYCFSNIEDNESFLYVGSLSKTNEVDNPDTGECLLISKYDNHGELVWQKDVKLTR